MNDFSLVTSVARLLSKHQSPVGLFGGWAEEVCGLSCPRPHKDVDFLYVANDFCSIDQLVSSCDALHEVEAKRFEHKRAFIFKGVLVELILLQQVNNKLVTNFWNLFELEWPSFEFQTIITEETSIKITPPEILKFYRSKFEIISSFRSKYAKSVAA